MTGRQHLFDLTGDHAVVSGAGRGIGRAAATALAAQGAELTLFDRSDRDLAETRELIERAGGRARAVIGDVTNEADLDRLVAATGEADLEVSIVVNCAGIVRRTAIEDFSLADLDALWEVNVRGTVAVTHRFVPGMVRRRRGKVVNVGSLGSVLGLERRTAYATTKGAVASYTQSLALELGPHGICVNAVGPGYVATEMTADWLQGDEERTARLLGRIPLGRFAETADVEGLFVFLSSRASDYITGQLVMLDGGWTCG